MKVNESFDPELKAAMEEIKPILEKYDCMASMVLISPTHSEFLYHLTTSWSVMKLESESLRFRSKKEDWPSVEIQNEATQSSVHALTTIIEWTRKTNSAFRSIVEQLGKHMKIAWETWE
jgi:hypothetical protein